MVSRVSYSPFFSLANFHFDSRRPRQKKPLSMAMPKRSTSPPRQSGCHTVLRLVRPMTLRPSFSTGLPFLVVIIFPLDPFFRRTPLLFLVVAVSLLSTPSALNIWAWHRLTALDVPANSILASLTQNDYCCYVSFLQVQTALTKSCVQ
jgi:hypothetical protein